jgi:hypothetical protein
VFFYNSYLLCWIVFLFFEKALPMKKFVICVVYVPAGDDFLPNLEKTEEKEPSVCYLCIIVAGFAAQGVILLRY